MARERPFRDFDAIFVPYGFEERAVRYGIRKANARIRLVTVPTTIVRAQEATMRALYSGRIERALVTGVCGLLAPELQPGDAVIYSDVRTAEYEPIPTNAGLSDALRKVFPEAYRSAHALSWNAIVTSAESKAELAARYSVSAVDTETFGVLAALGNAGVPTAVLRFGSDSAADALPDLNAAVKPDGTIDRSMMLRELVRKPGAGIRLVLGGSVAISRLARGVERLALA